MEVCLEGLASVQAIVGDSVVFAKDRRGHDTNLDNSLQRCQSKGIKLNADKLAIGEERAGCFALFVFLVSRDCCVALPHDATVCLQFVIVVFPYHTHLLFW